MEIEFDQDYLRELYQYGRSGSKKNRFQPEVIKNFIDAVNSMKSLSRLEDLYRIKSFQYEKKLGKLSGVEAIWINRQYRLEFISRQDICGTEFKTVCRLLRISNHYFN